MSNSDFKHSKGAPKTYTRSDLDTPRTRGFCSSCGAHLLKYPPSLPDGVLIKVGTFDDPSIFIGPKIIIHAAYKKIFSHILGGIPQLLQLK